MSQDTVTARDMVRRRMPSRKTGTFQYRKVDIQKIGYSLEKDGGEVFVLLPKGKSRPQPECFGGMHRWAPSPKNRYKPIHVPQGACFGKLHPPVR